MQVPSNGAKGFLNDYTVDSLTKHTLPAHPASILCESCDSKDKAVAYCQDCEGHLCEACITSHKTIKFLKGHKVEEISSEETIALPKKKSQTIYCSVHSRKELELYCVTCQRVVCLLCIVSSHNEHKFGSINSDTRHDMEAQINEYVAQVSGKLEFFKEKLEYTEKVEKDKISEQAKLNEEIKTFFNSLITTIETRMDALLKEVETDSNKDLKTIWAEKDFLGKTITVAENTLSFTNRSLKCTSDIEFLLLGAQLKDRLQQLSETVWNTSSISIIESKEQKFTAKTLSDLTTLGHINTLYTSSVSYSEDVPTVDAVEIYLPCAKGILFDDDEEQIQVKQWNKRKPVIHRSNHSPLDVISTQNIKGFGAYPTAERTFLPSNSPVRDCKPSYKESTSCFKEPLHNQKAPSHPEILLKATSHIYCKNGKIPPPHKSTKRATSKRLMKTENSIVSQTYSSAILPDYSD